MDKPNPSAEWTASERLEVIAWLVFGLREWALDHVASKTPMSPLIILNVTNAIGAVATATAAVLERRRDMVLQDYNAPSE